MAYKRSFTITVDSAENILNTEANAIFDEWVASGKILNSGSNVDPDDAKLLCEMKNKKIKGVSANVVSQAYPGLLDANV